MQKFSQSFEFHGKTGEFFKIWIVNMMLSIITLGIYSAWAKVRTRRYFYNNTVLMQSPFDYLADPLKILKGRLLAFAILLIYSMLSVAFPLLQGIFVLVFIPLLPWIIIKALTFNLYNSAYRNIRFHFKAPYLTALWMFVGLPVLVAFSLGLAYPYFVRERKKFVLDHSAYGTRMFKMNATSGQFYSIYMRTSAMVLLTLLLISALYFALQWLVRIQNSYQMMVTVMVVLMLISLPLFMLVYGYLYTTVTNLVINHTTLQQCQLESHLKTTEMCWLYFSNTLAIIFSLGLLVPWAMIRTARYRTSCLTLVSDDKPEAFITAEGEKAEAIAEELGDMLGVDFGL